MSRIRITTAAAKVGYGNKWAIIKPTPFSATHIDCRPTRP